MQIPFSQLPNTSKLIFDYFENFEQISGFYSGDYRHPENFLTRATDIKARELPMAKLIPVLKEQNQSYGCSLSTLEKIDRLLERHACAVVTGQQTGLFGGPLFTIYKALTAIKLAERLSRTCEGCYVPVFWLASDDHDFREVNHCKIIDQGNEIFTIRYDGFPADSRIPVSKIILGEEIEQSLQTLAESTHPSEFKQKILAQLREAYQPGTTFSTAFAKWLMALFKPFGLIIFDAADARIKVLGRDLFKQEITDYSPSSREAVAASEKLQQNHYHVQVPLKKDFLNLFYTENERVSMQVDKKNYLAKSMNRKFNQVELLTILQEHPDFFSPNVLLRPLYQDLLLPTVAYVAGPAEIAYYAQMKDIYQVFGLPMPIIYPRKSLTLLEAKIEKILQNHGLQVPDFFGNVESLINRLVRKRLPADLETRFTAAAHSVENSLQALDEYITEIEPTLTEFSKNTRGRIISQIQSLEKKILQASRKRNDVIRRQVYKAEHSLHPHNSLQERQLNIAPFLFKHGFGFIDQLYEAIDISNFDHQVVKI